MRDEVSAPEFQQGIVAGEIVPEADGIFVEIGVEMVPGPGFLEDVFRNKTAQGLAQQGEHAQAASVEAGRIETFGHQMPLDEADGLQRVRLQHAAAFVVLPGIDAQDGFRREVVVQNGVQRGPGGARQMQKKERLIHGVLPETCLYTSPGPSRKRGGRTVLASAA